MRNETVNAQKIHGTGVHKLTSTTIRASRPAARGSCGEDEEMSRLPELAYRFASACRVFLVSLSGGMTQILDKDIPD
ncbi:unnamed protein product [Schistocephalus solidus]|uniref:Uridylate kinase n=1 Tax=Schistocephalus solidus TaxID=70667 RepID=A0A183S9N6_SCHSO|nr:unnamed protein product [Schistocephalus solidus]